jgi:fused signal recognition particle receptor
MFGILKKKLNDFSSKLKENITKKEPKEKTEPEKKELPLKENKPTKEEVKQTKTISKPKKETKKHTKEEKIIEQETEKKEVKAEIKQPIKENKEIETKIEEIPEVEKKKEIVKETPIDDDKRELKSKVKTTSKLKSLFTGSVEIKESDIEDLLWELELSLIESDVDQDASKEIAMQIKKRLVGKKVSSRNVDEVLKESIKEIITEMLEIEKIDLLKNVEKKKPYVIMFLGPNGAGKTTSIAKLTNFLKENNKTCVLAAADTFRAGAIDQLKIHAKNLDTKVISHQYGADPAAVCFDAIKSAEANNNDVVIIDTAGRQETNKNLMEELKKIERVAKPDLKIFVGEAYTGQSLLEMSTEFNDSIGIDAFILTKIDTDAKGGTSISLVYKLEKPIMYVGTGQEYSDFEEFDTKFILDRII